MTVQKITFKNNEEWRHERAKSVGASAVGTILGLSHFMSPKQLAEKMRAEIRGEFDFSQTMAMMRGHAYEGGVAQLFEWRTGLHVIQSSSVESIFRRSDIPFLHVSPDRIYWLDAEGPQHGKTAETNKGVLECKTTRRSVKADALPLPWLLQLQTQMGVTGYHSGALAWDVLSKTEGFGFALRDFNEEVFSAIVKLCEEFWYRSIIGDKDPYGINYLQNHYPILYSESWTHDIRSYDVQIINNTSAATPLAFPFCPHIEDAEEPDTDEQQLLTSKTPQTLSWVEKLLTFIKK